MRLELLDAERMTPGHQALLKGVEKRFGAPLHSLRMLAHSTPCLDAVVAFEMQHAAAGSLPERLRALVNLATARLIGCHFCIDLGTREALQAGVSEAQLGTLADHRTSAAFSADEQVALDYAEAVSLHPHDIDEALFARLRDLFSAEQIVELTTLIAWENFRSRFNRALDLPAHGVSPEQVRPPAAH